MSTTSTNVTTTTIIITYVPRTTPNHYLAPSLYQEVVGVSEVTIQTLPRHLAGPCSLPYNSTVAIISNMAVKQAHRRMGIGRQLLHQCCAFAGAAAGGGQLGDDDDVYGIHQRPHNTTSQQPPGTQPPGTQAPSHAVAVLLYVHKYNDAALQLYEKSGFGLIEWTDPAWLESAYRGEAAGSRKLLMMKKMC